jgi:hypothetical protein
MTILPSTCFRINRPVSSKLFFPLSLQSERIRQKVACARDIRARQELVVPVVSRFALGVPPASSSTGFSAIIKTLCRRRRHERFSSDPVVRRDYTGCAVRKSSGYVMAAGSRDSRTERMEEIGVGVDAGQLGRPTQRLEECGDLSAPVQAFAARFATAARVCRPNSTRVLQASDGPL